MSTEEDKLLDQLLATKPPAPTGGRERFRPSAPTAYDIADVRSKLEKEFGTLPISVFGQGARHNSEGFDHRNAMDVALNPNSDEGRRLTSYLRDNRIPFEAFTNSHPIRNRAGKVISTGEHIHVGFSSKGTSATYPVGTTRNEDEANQLLDQLLSSPAPATDITPEESITNMPTARAASDTEFNADALLDQLLSQPEKQPHVTSRIVEGDGTPPTTPLEGNIITGTRPHDIARGDLLSAQGTYRVQIDVAPSDTPETLMQKGLFHSAKGLGMSDADAQTAAEEAYNALAQHGAQGAMIAGTNQAITSEELQRYKDQGVTTFDNENPLVKEVFNKYIALGKTGHAIGLSEQEMMARRAMLNSLRESGTSHRGRSLEEGFAGYGGGALTKVGNALSAFNDLDNLISSSKPSSDPLGIGASGHNIQRTGQLLSEATQLSEGERKLGLAGELTRGIGPTMGGFTELTLLSPIAGHATLPALGALHHYHEGADATLKGAAEGAMLAGGMALFPKFLPQRFEQPLAMGERSTLESGAQLPYAWASSNPVSTQFIRGAANAASWTAVPTVQGVNEGLSWTKAFAQSLPFGMMAGTEMFQILSPRARARLEALPSDVQRAYVRNPDLIELGLDKQREIERAVEDHQFRRDSGAQLDDATNQKIVGAVDTLLTLEDTRNGSEWSGLAPKVKKDIIRNTRLLRESLPDDMVREMRSERDRYYRAAEKFRNSLPQRNAEETAQPPYPQVAATQSPEPLSEQSAPMPVSSARDERVELPQVRNIAPTPKLEIDPTTRRIIQDGVATNRMLDEEGRIVPYVAPVSTPEQQHVNETRPTPEVEAEINTLGREHSELNRTITAHTESLRRGGMDAAITQAISSSNDAAVARRDEIAARSRFLNAELERRRETPIVATEPVSKFTAARLNAQGEVENVGSHAAANYVDNEVWLDQLADAARKEQASGGGANPVFERNGWRAEDGTFISMREMSDAGGIEEAYAAKKNGATPLPSDISTTFNSGVEPSLDLIREGAQKIYTVTKDYVQWASQMIAKFGASVRDYLSDIWQSVTQGTKLPSLQEIAADPESAFNRRRGERGVLELGLQDRPEPERDDPMREGRDDTIPIPPDKFLNTDNLRRYGLSEPTIAEVYRAQRQAIDSGGGKEQFKETVDSIREKARVYGDDLANLISDRPDDVSLLPAVREKAEQLSTESAQRLVDLHARTKQEVLDNPTRDMIEKEIEREAVRLRMLRSIIFPSDSEAGRRLGMLYWMGQRSLDPAFWTEFAKRRAERAGVDTNSQRFRAIEDDLFNKATEAQKLKAEADLLKAEVESALREANAGQETGLGTSENVSRVPNDAQNAPRASRRQNRKERQDVIELQEARAKVEEKRQRVRDAQAAGNDPQKIKAQAEAREQTLREQLDKVIRQINGQEDVTLTPVKLKELENEKVTLQKMLAENKRYLVQLTRMMASQRGVSEPEQARVTAQDRIEKQAQDEITRLESQLETVVKQVKGKLPLHLQNQGPQSYESDPRVLSLQAAIKAERAKLRTTPWGLQDLLGKELSLWEKKVEKLEGRFKIASQVKREYQVAIEHEGLGIGKDAAQTLKDRIAQAEGKDKPSARPNSPEIQTKIDRYKELQSQIQTIRKYLARRASNLEDQYFMEKAATVGKMWMLTSPIGALKDWTGTTLFQGVEMLSHIPASAFDIMLGTKGGQRYILRPGMEELQTFVKGYGKGLGQMWHILQRGATPEQLQRMELPQELKVYTRLKLWNTLINDISPMGTRLRAAFDNTSFVGALEYHYLMAAKAQIKNEITARKLLPEASQQRFAELILRPSETLGADSLFNTLMNEATRQAEIATFHNQNFITKKLMRLRREGREEFVGRLFNFVLDQKLPFAKAVTNVQKLGLFDYTPIGLATQLFKFGPVGRGFFAEKLAQQKITDNYAILRKIVGEQLTPEQRKDLAIKLGRGATGSVFHALGYTLAGGIGYSIFRGFNPPARDDKEYQIETQQGREPGMGGAFQGGEYSLDLQWLGPIALSMMSGAISRQADDMDMLMEKQFVFASQAPTLRGINTTARDIRDLRHPFMKGGEILGREARRFVPLGGLAGDAAKLTDIDMSGEVPRITDRDPRTTSQPFDVHSNPVLSNFFAFGQQLEQGVPGLRQDVPPSQPSPRQIRFRERKVRSILEPPPWLSGTYK